MTADTTKQTLEATIDATLADTFPASDPPAWTLGREPHSTTQAVPGSPQAQAKAHLAAIRSKDESQRLTILGIAGSLRHDSYDRAVLRAAQQFVPANTALDIFDLAGIPPFNQDDEQTPSTVVVEFKTRILAADAILIAAPEYNYSFPGVLKNALDWASHPPSDNVSSGKPVAILGVLIGRPGTACAQYHLRQVCVTLNMYPLNQPEVMISNAGELFDAIGNLTDKETQTRLQLLLDQLVKWTQQLQRGRT